MQQKHQQMVLSEILAQHEYVIVDGKRYKLVSTKIIGRKYTQEVRDYAYANQGIVFQTCYGNNENLLVHYEPCWFFDFLVDS